MKLVMIAMLLVPFTGASVLYDTSGSTIFSSSCDDCYQLVQLADTYRFFGKSYTQTWIGSNGYLTFDEGHRRYEPPYPPISAWNGSVMVAPWFSDIYLNGDVLGHISFKETQDNTMLKKARRMIRGAFPKCGDTFQPTSMFITTWHDVQSYCEFYMHFFYKKRDVGEEQSMPNSGKEGVAEALQQYAMDPSVADKALWKLNTFQVALITDGWNTFAVFNYEKIHWRYCWEENQILFNAGDGVGLYWHDESHPNEGTNVNSAGRWVYKISASKIISPECDVVGT